MATLDDILKSQRSENDLGGGVFDKLRKICALDEQEKLSTKFLDKSIAHNATEDEKMLHDIRGDLRSCVKANERKLTLISESHGTVAELLKKIDDDMRRLQKDAARDDDDDKKKKQVVQKRPRQKNYASMLSGDFTSRDDYDYADEYGSEYASAALDDDVSATVSMPHTPHHHGHHGHATREAVVAADVEPRPYEFCCHKDTGEDMIGCDNDNCAHGGWFHFSCVGLTYKPEGDWYCPGCASTLKKKKRSTY